jgi:hypothetical protein
VITWPALADAVRQCAARPAGAVHVVGRPGGVIRLRAGAVVGTWTTGTPLAVPTPGSGPRSPAATAGPLARLAMTDAVFVMAAGRVTGWRTEDDPAPAPEGVRADLRMDLEALLQEVDRRIRRVFGPDGMLPPEETVVRRLERPGTAVLAPTHEERRLLDALGPAQAGRHRDEPPAPTGSAPHLVPVRDGRTVRELAFALGRGVFGVLLDVQRLAAMGAVALSARPAAPPGPPHSPPHFPPHAPPPTPPPAQPPAPPGPALVVQARQDLDGLSVAAVSAALRRRRDEFAGQEPAPRPSPPPPGLAPTTLAKRVPGASGADRPRRRAPWQPRRAPDGGGGQ